MLQKSEYPSYGASSTSAFAQGKQQEVFLMAVEVIFGENDKTVQLSHKGAISISFFYNLIRPHESLCRREDKSFINYVKGANIAGFVKVAEAMLEQGVV